MADTLIQGLMPGRGAEFGDTIFESFDTLGVVEDENLLTLNLGPQHPSTHGVFRMVMQLQGETVIAATPVMGYLHRSSEKLGEARTYNHGTVLTDRMDYLSPITTNWAYALSIERLTGLVVPERAEYLRVITGELSRIQSHLVAVGTFGMDVGTYGTPLLYALREREAVLDLLSLPTGVRMNPSYIRYGGVARDAPPEFFPQLERFLRIFPSKIDEYEAVLAGNEVFRNRTVGVGMIPPEVARAYSVTGPILRASGIEYDVRRAEPYSIYDRFDWDVPVHYNGDCFDRYMVRLEEMRQSTRILQQALESIPEGDIRAKMGKVLRPPKGEAYARIEGPKGEIGFYLISDGTVNPYRYNCRPPSFVNLTCLAQIAVGHKLADAVVILGSFDIVMGEVDR
ncbi:MAG TPA: NADH-quinone oxidoreductase subunit D [Chloroflexota bacterium]|nr:NADH-quinone oxidoreductase subunit D [Chloroflexota bacterium]